MRKLLERGISDIDICPKARPAWVVQCTWQMAFPLCGLGWHLHQNQGGYHALTDGLDPGSNPRIACRLAWSSMRDGRTNFSGMTSSQDGACTGHITGSDPVFWRPMTYLQGSMQLQQLPCVPTASLLQGSLQAHVLAPA